MFFIQVLMLSFYVKLSNGQVHITGNVGETVVLPCKNGDVHGQGQWLKGDQVIADRRTTHFDERLQIVGNIEDNDYNLKIKNLSISDEGLYRCIAKSDGKAKFIDVFLVVFDNKTDNSAHLYFITTDRNNNSGVMHVNGDFSLGMVYAFVIFVVLTTIVVLVSTLIHVFVVRRFQKININVDIPNSVAFVNSSYTTDGTYDEIDHTTNSQRQNSGSYDVIENQITDEDAKDSTKVKEITNNFSKESTNFNVYQKLHMNATLCQTTYNQLKE